jgi:predicted secreted protein
MKISKRVAATLSSLVLIAGLAAVSAGPAQAVEPRSDSDVTLVVQELPAQVRLIPGEAIELTLQTNRTTGYTWIAQGGGRSIENNRRVARVSRGVYTAPQNTGGMVGVPGTTTWTITAKRVGVTDVTIVTRPPGAQNTMTDEEVGVLRLIVMKPE